MIMLACLPITHCVVHVLTSVCVYLKYVVGVGIHVDHHAFGGARIVQGDNQHDRIQEVIEQLEGV